MAPGGTNIVLVFVSGCSLLFHLRFALADHPCTDEVASACPDRPAADVATCLKDPQEHDQVTEISSECTDFVALNKACAEDIEKFCDGSAFTDDTIICLTQWTEKENLSPRCQGVLSWALPQSDEEEQEEVTDELGMSEQDRQEKEEWRAKRKAVRDEAVGRMKMKDEDRKKEEDRIALDEFKKADPEGYAQMIEQQEEEKRQKAEIRRMERARAAALERKKRVEMGEGDDDAPKQQASKSKTSPKKKGGSWLYSILSFGVVGAVGALIYYIGFANPGPTARKTGGGGGKQGKKRR